MGIRKYKRTINWILVSLVIVNSSYEDFAITAKATRETNVKYNIAIRTLGHKLHLPKKQIHKRDHIPNDISNTLLLERQKELDLVEQRTRKEISTIIIYGTAEPNVSHPGCIKFNSFEKFTDDHINQANLWIYLNNYYYHKKENRFLTLNKINKRTGVKTSLGVYNIPQFVKGWYNIILMNIGQFIPLLESHSVSCFGLTCHKCSISKMNSTMLPYLTLTKEVKIYQRKRRDNLCKRDEKICCVKNLLVDLTNLTSNAAELVYIPKSINVGMCSGECFNVHDAAKVGALRIHKGLCCAPIKYKPLAILVNTGSNGVAVKTLHDVVVTECGCV